MQMRVEEGSSPSSHPTSQISGFLRKLLKENKTLLIQIFLCFEKKLSVPRFMFLRSFFQEVLSAVI